MTKKEMYRSIALGAILAILLMVALSYTDAQTVGTFDRQTRSFTDGEVRTWSPTQLTVNAATLGASIATPDSSIMDVRGAQQVTWVFSCGQIVDVRLNVYDLDGTTKLGTYTVNSAVPAAAHVFTIHRELAPMGTGGTIPTPNLTLPQRAIGIVFLNTTATPSTCTARAIAQF